MSLTTRNSIQQHKAAFSCLQILVLLVLVFMVTAKGKAQSWQSYTSDHFIVFSDSAEFRTVEEIRKLEAFHSLVLQATGLGSEGNVRPLPVYLISNLQDYNRIITPEDKSGYFRYTDTGPQLVIGPNLTSRDRQEIWHHLAHYLVDNLREEPWPHWYNEGLALLLSSAELYPDIIRTGSMPLMLDRDFDRMPPLSVEKTLSARGDTDFAFYYSAWLLTHLLLQDEQNRLTPAVSSLTDLLETSLLTGYEAQLDESAPADETDPSVETSASALSIPALAQVSTNSNQPEQAGDESETLDIELNRYNYRYSLMLKEWEAPSVSSSEIVKFTLTDQDGLSLLADLALDLGNLEAGMFWLERTRARDDQGRLDAASWGKAARLYADRGDNETSNTLQDMVISSGDTSNSFYLTRMAAYNLDKHYQFDLVDDMQLVANQALDAAITLAMLSQDTAPGSPETLYVLALAYEANGELQKAVDTMSDAYDIEKSSPVLNLQLSRLLALGNQLNYSLLLLDRILGSSHSMNLSEQIRTLQSSMLDGTARLDAYDPVLEALPLLPGLPDNF